MLPRLLPCCLQCCCPCLYSPDSCHALEASEDTIDGAPLLTSSTPSSSSSSSSSSSNAAPVLYFAAVRGAFKEHFAEDPELQAMFKEMGMIEATTLVVRALRYRDARIASGNVLLDCPHNALARSMRFDVAAPAASSSSTTGSSTICECFVSSKPLCQSLVSRLVFAELAYEDSAAVLRKRLKSLPVTTSQPHELVAHEPATALFEPAYFISLSLASKELVVAIRGTSSSQDWLTNLFIKPGYLVLPSASVPAGQGLPKEDFIVHGGVLQAARFVLSRAGQLIQTMANAGFRIVVVGHSLGGGVASVLAIILREEMSIASTACFAYAPPPAVSKRLADLSTSYVFSAVNGDDCIPRTSVSSLKSFAASIYKLRELYKMAGSDWSKSREMLDRMEWAQIVESAVKVYVEKGFDTYLPGTVLFCFASGPPSTGSSLVGHKTVVAMQVPSDYAPLRLPALSGNMVADHSIVAYRKSLESAASSDVVVVL